MRLAYSTQRRTPIASSLVDGMSEVEHVEGGIDDRGQHVVLPLAVDQEVCGSKALDLKATAPEHGRAPLVPWHVVGGHPVQPPPLESECDGAVHRFGHVALALLVPREVVAEHARLE